MKAPIKERIILLRYKRIMPDSYASLCGAFRAFVAKFQADGALSEELLYQPEVSFPAPPVGDKEPDWSQLKVSLERPSRFWDKSHRLCVQIFRECFSVNLVTKNGYEDCGFTELCAFYDLILPFLKEHKHAFESTQFSVDYVNQLSGAQLKDFLEKDGNTLAVGKLLNMPALGPTIPGMSFRPPIEQHLNYGFEDPKDGSPLDRTSVNIVIPEPKDGTNWTVNIMLRSERLQCSNLFDSDDNSLLQLMHEHVRACFNYVFAPSALNLMELHK